MEGKCFIYRGQKNMPWEVQFYDSDDFEWDDKLLRYQEEAVSLFNSKILWDNGMTIKNDNSIRHANTLKFLNNIEIVVKHRLSTSLFMRIYDSVSKTYFGMEIQYKIPSDMGLLYRSRVDNIERKDELFDVIQKE